MNTIPMNIEITEEVYLYNIFFTKFMKIVYRYFYMSVNQIF